MAKKSLLFGSVLAMTLGIGLCSPSAFGEEPACVKAQKWVEAHRDSLPETYDQYLASPPQYRRAILGALPPATKAAFWTEHVQRFRDAHPELNADQLALIDEALELIGRPETFLQRASEQKRTDPVIKKSIELGNHAKLLFSREDATALLAQLDATPNGTPRGEKNPHFKVIDRECECSAFSDWCWISEYCKTGNCTMPLEGCGTFGLNACDGLCKRSGTV